MADNPYKIELGIGLRESDFTKIKNDIKSLEDKPIRLEIDAETKELTKTIQDALKALSKGGQNTFTIDTSEFTKSIDGIKTAVVDLQRTLGSLGDNVNMKDLLTSVNQIANAIGKVTDESETLAKSLSILSKKEFGFNFNLKTGNANPLKAATDYGKEARRNAIPALQEQASALQNLLGGYLQADKALERYLTKIHKASGISIKNSLIDDMSNTGSIAKQMEAIEKYIGYLRSIAVEKGINLSGFDAQFSKAAENIVDDTVKIQTGARQTEEALEAVGKEMKQIFGGGVSAEGLSAQLEPIIANLGEIKIALQDLSKGFSLDGLTVSFDRLSESIENLLANAERVKGVLNSNFDVGMMSAGVKQTKIPATSRKKTRSASDEYIDSYLKHWNITGEDAKTVKSKFKSLVQASSRGIDDGLYESSVEDLIHTVKQLGTASRQADDQLEKVFNTLKTYHIDASRDKYKKEFGDDWKSERAKHSAILANRNSGSKISVDSAYQELSGLFPSLFPDDIWNEADQLKKIFEVYDRAKEATKGGKVSLSEVYSDSDLRAEVKDIVDALQEQSRLEKEVAQTSAQTSNAISQGQQEIRQEYDKTSDKLEQLTQKKKRLEEIDREISDYNDKFADASANGNIDEAQRYFEGMTNLEGEKSNLESEIKQIEIALENTEQQAKQTADAIQSISKETSLVRDGVVFDEVFDKGNQSAKEAQKHFEALLKEEKAVISVQEGFDNSGALKSFTVNVQRATGEVEKLHYAMSSADNDNRFLYQGASVSDRNIEKLTEARIKKVNDLQIKLDKIKTAYENMGANKPIKEEAHIKSLSEQYDKVQAAIESVKSADSSTYTSMVSNAEKEKAALESLVQVYRSAETFSTDLRAKDRDTAKEVYSSRLDVLSTKMKKDGVYDGLSSDVGTLSTKIANASDVKALSEIANELTKLDAKYKSAKAAKDEFNRSQNVGSSVSSLKSDIEILQKASPSINGFKTEINGAEVSIESLLKDLSQVDTKGDFDVVKGKVEAFGKAAEAAGIDLNEAKTEAKKINDVYKQMLEIQKQIRSLSIKEKNLTELGSTNELNEVSVKLKDLKSDYETLKRTFGDKLTSTQFGNLQAEIDETESELKQLDAKFADTKAKLANQIKIKISDTGFNGFEQEVARAHAEAEKLEGTYNDLEIALRNLDNAMDAVYSADQSGDVKRLVAANEEYETSLKQVYSQLKLYQQAEQKAYKNDLLQQKKASLSSEMEIWLKENTRAAKDYGEEIRRLQASLDGLDDKGLKLAGQKFKNLTKEAKAFGKTGLTVFDKLKSKAKEYMAYFSVAELFMYAEQAFREMFNTVKEIDTAMTGLYRVTDLTAAEYDTLFNNMISSAKEYGATLNDIINATTDWVRAGFDANTSLGLAEVTTMYQHISDLDYDTAAENLITAYNGFKDELNGAFSGDTVSAVNYIADILNELDR